MNELDTRGLREAVRTIWEATLGLAVEHAPVERAVGSLRRDQLSGSIRISGRWEGTVHVDFAPGLARGAAALMFGIDPVDATADMVCDALGELTNIIGGNIKALLPGPCTLSLPEVTECTGGWSTNDSAGVIARFGFTSLDGDFLVTVRKDETVSSPL